MSSAGPEAAELAATCGLVLDDWQRFSLEHSMAERADGQWCAADVALIASRQNGKNGAVEARELYGLTVIGEWIIHTAHLFKTTRESYDRLLSLIEGSPDTADQLVHKVASPASGYEMRFRNGGRIVFIARSRSSGRGLTGDLLVCDEAQDLDDDALGALLPVLSARPNRQAWFQGSAPGEKSTVLHRMRQRGRAGGDDRFAYFEFSAEPTCDLDDREAWAQANPALGIRITLEAIEAERASMSDEMFARERLSVSPDLVEDGQDAPIDPSIWALGVDKASKIVGEPTFAVDMTPDRRKVSVAVCGARADGLPHVELIAYEPSGDHVVPLLMRLGRPIHLDPGGPAGGLLPALTAAGVETVLLGSREVAQACGALKIAADGGLLRHLGDPLLESAVVGAKARRVGDAWAWSRKDSTVDISPLVAVTIAHGKHLSTVPEPEQPFFIY